MLTLTLNDEKQRKIHKKDCIHLCMNKTGDRNYKPLNMELEDKNA